MSEMYHCFSLLTELKEERHCEWYLIWRDGLTSLATRPVCHRQTVWLVTSVVKGNLTYWYILLIIGEPGFTKVTLRFIQIFKYLHEKLLPIGWKPNYRLYLRPSSEVQIYNTVKGKFPWGFCQGKNWLMCFDRLKATVNFLQRTPCQ